MTPVQHGAMIAAARMLLGLSQAALAELVSAPPKAIAMLEAGEPAISLKERIATLFEQFGLSIRYDDGGATLRIVTEARLSAEMALALHHETTLETARANSQEGKGAARAALLVEFDAFRLSHRSTRQAIIHFVRLLARRKGGLKPARRTLERWLEVREKEGERGLKPAWAGGRRSLFKTNEALRLALGNLVHASPRPTLKAMVQELKMRFPDLQFSSAAVSRAIPMAVASGSAIVGFRSSISVRTPSERVEN